MDSKTYGIGILTLTAVALLLANLFAPSPVSGIESVANNDMQAVTCHASQGGDALYLYEPGSGKMAIFTVNNKSGLQLNFVADIETAFRENAGGGGRERNR